MVIEDKNRTKFSFRFKIVHLKYSFSKHHGFYQSFWKQMYLNSNQLSFTMKSKRTKCFWIPYSDKQYLATVSRLRLQTDSGLNRFWWWRLTRFTALRVRHLKCYQIYLHLGPNAVTKWAIRNIPLLEDSLCFTVINSSFVSFVISVKCLVHFNRIVKS